MFKEVANYILILTLMSLFAFSVAASPNSVSCLEKAAHPWDYEGGTEWDQLDADNAILECERLSEILNEDFPVAFALARAYSKAERYEPAFEILEYLRQEKFGPAVRLLALHYYHGDGKPLDHGKAEQLFIEAIRLGDG